MIHEYVLITGSIFPYVEHKKIPNDLYDGMKFEIPTVAWVVVMANLGTIYKEEAQAVLMERNTVVYNQNNHFSLRHWRLLPRIKSLSFVYSSSDLDCESRIAEQEEIRFSDARWSSMDWRSKCEMLHNIQLDALHEIWSSRNEYWPSKAMSHIEIDVMEAFCPNGCCRMAEEACSSIFLESIPTELIIIGAEDEDEKETILSVIRENSEEARSG